MSTSQVSQVSDNAREIRRTAEFPPSIWGDRFINYDSEQAEIHNASQLQEIEELKEQVRKELSAAVNNSLQKPQLDLIDAIERQGVGYHFETEIQQVLQHLYNTYNVIDAHDQYDLHTAALCFRLLRQHGHHVSSDIFNKFKDNKGNFKESLASDVSGMLSLYEAAHVGVHGEDILDEAIEFTTTHLQSYASVATINHDHLSNPRAEQVIHALRRPLHKRVPRIEARRYISIYQDHEPSHNQALLKLAKIDFNLVQSLHKKEISQLCRWAKDLDFTGKLPFARDRMVEGYFWILGMVPDLQYSLARIVIAKAIHILTIIDDTYDAYGTLAELALLAEAFERFDLIITKLFFYHLKLQGEVIILIFRWDASCLDQLPEYMQIIYKSFLDFGEEIEEEISNKGWSTYRVDYVKEIMKKVVRASLEEAKWINDKRIPTMEEYLQAGLVIAGLGTITTLLLVTLDYTVTKETFDWVLSRPAIITSSELHFRLLDDIKTHKFEQERGHDTSSVEIYMKQSGVSEQEAYEELQKLVKNAWKDVNKECLRLADNRDLPKPMLSFILNYPRIIYLMYEKDDYFTRVGREMQAYVESLLIDPVPI
ncbi:hypothetical protein Dsin_026697 [Dipteronia sinensis]|uniref:Uncharacterized protein n=1 Tax=Dipteronia sinensis TaxID=43782 RepID=A0AAD9ZYS4_9ROSI|nr:hypothetical protein Dsin_026697 [Dipteronia sinensis]